MSFTLTSSFAPAGDQPEAIESLVANLNLGVREQTLLGVTGSGKTYTIANVIARTNLPTLVISHNKTLAAQLYQEFKSFFAKNAVSYFVSYYDYYQPEAYIPQTDTYIEKETEINEEIDKLRLAATTNLLTRPDTIIIASVSCIYNIGSPKEYGSFILELRKGVKVTRDAVIERLVEMQYERSEYGFHRGTFRVRGETIDVYPAYEDTSIRLRLDGNQITEMMRIDSVSGDKLEHFAHMVLYPAKHYMTDPHRHQDVYIKIEDDLTKQLAVLKSQQKLLEAHRLEQKVHYDLELIKEVGYVNGIENYSRYFDGREPGDPPFTLFDYYQERHGNKWLLIIDESHMTVPQIRGMYNGDRARKQTLVDFGFRLPSALDNRPLKFDEFLRRTPQVIYVSATPDDWEISRSNEAMIKVTSGARQTKAVVEQLVRPTGLVDPEVIIRPIEGQIRDLIEEIRQRVKNKERVLVTTLTKRMAEDLAAYLEEKKFKVHYLHADLETLERSDILDNLRRGTYDVVVGINLLREGLDLPEVSLVAILDADKEGFLRSKVSLIQTMGRAARHVKGTVIMYADQVTKSMKAAIWEVARRRAAQIAYNQAHSIIPQSITKPIRERLVEYQDDSIDLGFGKEFSQKSTSELLGVNVNALTPLDLQKLIKKLEREMRRVAGDLNFELAVRYRDKIRELRSVK